MEASQVVDIGREAIYVLLKISLPILLAGLIVGLLVSLFQALTQIQEMTLAFIPKIIAVFLAILFTFPFIGNQIGALQEMLVDRIINSGKS